MFENQMQEDFADINADDTASRPIVTRAARVPFSRRGRAAGGAWVEGGSLVSEADSERRAVLPQADLPLPAAHNLENATAAPSAAGSLGTPANAITTRL